MSNRKIPDPIKRTLRQEANFGCCKCGNPIIEYHHIIPWHNVKVHNAKEMMILCPTCHHSIDSYSQENQRNFKSNPFNLNNANIPGTLIISQRICAIDTGVIKLLGDGPVIVSKDKSFLEFYVSENDILEISLNLFNQEEKLVFKIIKNEWIEGDIQSWDIEFISGSKTLIIREKKGIINLKIDAKKMPVSVEGDFWVNGNLLSFNKKGITFNKISTLKKAKNVSNKFGIYHFEADAWAIQIGKNSDGKVGPDSNSKTIYTNSCSFAGVDFYSGCWMEIEKTNISLRPKPTPFEWRCGNSMSISRAEEVLIQSIKTIQYCDSNITFISDFNDKLSGGMIVVDKQLSLIPFKKKLARFYVLTKQHQKALSIYSEIHIQQHTYYNYPNIDEGETNLEISKYLFSLKNIERAKEIFIEAFICFQTTNNLPFRLLDFSIKLFNNTDKCFCGSEKNYNECHYYLCTLVKYAQPKQVPIKITGLPNECRVSLYFLKTHKTHALVYSEEYLKRYELVFTEKCNSSFDYKIKTNKDIPMIIHIFHYGSLPILSEFVLREEGLNMNIENAT